MQPHKLAAGAPFPLLTVPMFGGGELALGKPGGGRDWQMVVVYRGKHCPICTRYLGTLNELLPKFHELGVDVVAVSADPQERAAAQMGPINPKFPVGINLSLDQMRQLGVYISQPRSEQETDRPFSEPGLFVINAQGQLQITDISNAPFARPDLNVLLQGLGFVRNPQNNYPVRGTFIPA
jgi:peroxiredoxin